MSITATESKNLFEAIKACTNENAVKEIIDNHTFTSNKKNWNPLGDNPNNAAMTQNTGGTFGACMAELITNASDAVITRLKEDAENQGKIFPETALVSPENLLQFLQPDAFKSKKDLRDFSRELMGIVSTEYDVNKDMKIRTRNITIFDKGCGQKSENFKNTFCSIGLGKANKANISWLHGSYGQGSSAANTFSGKYGYKLIISRKGKNDNWAWTIIRRSPEDPSMLEYLILDSSHNVLEFEAELIEMAYYCNTNEVAEGVATIEYGSMIKIFSVNMKKGFTEMKKTVGTAMLRPVLPIQSFEFSYSKEGEKNKKEHDLRWIDGLGKYIDDLVKENKAVVQSFEIIIPQLEKPIYGLAYFVESDEEIDEFKQWLPLDNKNTRLFYMNNGQVQNTDNISIIGKHFPSLKENVIMEFDFSYVNQKEAKGYLFKADRLSFQTGTDLYRQFFEKINAMIESSEFLKAWNTILRDNRVKHAYTNHTDAKVKSTISHIERELLTGNKTKNHNIILIQEDQKSLSDKLIGKLASSEKTEMNTEIVEVKGKVHATKFKKVAGELKVNKKAEKGNVFVKFKTDAKKGTVVGKDAVNKVRVKNVMIHKTNGAENPCNEDYVTLSVTEGKDNHIICDIGFDKNLQQNFEDGDKVFVEIELETTDEATGEVILLKEEASISIVYEEVKKNKGKKEDKSLGDLFDITFATLDKRTINGKPTSKLPFNFNKDLGSHIFFHKDQFIIQVNLDNPEIQYYLSEKKYCNEVEWIIERVYDLISTSVISSYRVWIKAHKDDNIESFCDSENEATSGLKTIAFIMSQIHLELVKMKTEKKKEVL